MTIFTPSSVDNLPISPRKQRNLVTSPPRCNLSTLSCFPFLKVSSGRDKLYWWCDYVSHISAFVPIEEWKRLRKRVRPSTSSLRFDAKFMLDEKLLWRCEPFSFSSSGFHNPARNAIEILMTFLSAFLESRKSFVDDDLWLLFSFCYGNMKLDTVSRWGDHSDVEWENKFSSTTRWRFNISTPTRPIISAGSFTSVLALNNSLRCQFCCVEQFLGIP